MKFYPGRFWLVAAPVCFGVLCMLDASEGRPIDWIANALLGAASPLLALLAMAALEWVHRGR